jgi:hypothetical protein
MTANEILSLLAAADPAREAGLPRPDAPEARALKERILSAPTRARARSRPVRPWLVGAILATAAVTAVGLPRALEHDPVGVSPAAAAVLERAAAATARTTPAAAGRYAYTETRTVFAMTDTDDPPFTALVPGVQETWVAADGSGRIRTVRGEPYFPSERDRRRWLDHGSPRLGLAAGSVSIDRLRRPRADAAALAKRDPATLDARELDRLLNSPAALPTGTDALERMVRAYARTKDPPPESMMYDQLDDLLTDPYGSGALRAAAYRVLARMKGIELRGPIRDPIGRRGTAIDFPGGYTDAIGYRLVIDPATGAVLAEETLLGRPNQEVAGMPGRVLGQVVYVRSGWVDRLGSRPAADR